MLKIKVIDPKSGFRMTLPMPYHLFINLFVRKRMITFILRQQVADLYRRIDSVAPGDQGTLLKMRTQIKNIQSIHDVVEQIDFYDLRGSLHALSEYDDLPLVDIEAHDGTIVKITV